MTKTALMTLCVALTAVLLTAVPAMSQPGPPDGPGKAGPPSRGADRPDGPDWAGPQNQGPGRPGGPGPRPEAPQQPTVITITIESGGNVTTIQITTQGGQPTFKMLDRPGGPGHEGQPGPDRQGRPGRDGQRQGQGGPEGHGRRGQPSPDDAGPGGPHGHRDAPAPEDHR